ncbi:protein phosphatase 2C domain-containing protein [Streptomyces beigongshangae]|uniref:protein phosphatase 2C domain-containing protein n=1 Tax=Streptomyces beigongshangae TaxID=2841597 RepID=UPI001C8585AD|nr:protein phosphatase 2C domain-containing protein [Streptomyces sp. REN17]
MSQQGERPTGRQDDWWGQLYDDATEDTGPAPASDSLDDRFVSATNTLETPTPEQPSRRGREEHHARPPHPAPDPAPGGTPTGNVPAQGGTPVPPASSQGRGERRDQLSRPVPDTRLGGTPTGFAENDPPPWWPPSGPGAAPAAGKPRTADPRGPVPAAPDPEPSQRGGGSRRRRAPWEAPSAEPPRPTTFLPGPGATPSTGMSTEVPGSAAPTSRPPTAAGTPTHGDAPVAGQTAGTGTDTGAGAGDAPAGAPPDQPFQFPDTPDPLGHVGSGPPTYAPEPTALPSADPDALDDLVADTVLDGASYGTCTLRAVSVRGDSARYRGEPRRDSLLTARFGTGDGALVLVAMATGARATPDAHRAAAEACQWIGRAVGRSHARLAEDIRAARRGDLKSGLHRLTDRSLGKLRAGAAERGIEPEEYTASLRCLLLPADPECRTRVFFGVGAGGLFRLRDGEWQDLEPRAADTTGEAVVGFGSLPHETPAGDRLTMDLGITTPPSPYEPAPEAPARDPFRFRASVARPGDALLLCTGGLAEPLRGEPRLVEHLTSRWSGDGPPGLAAFLADSTVRVKGYADDRTAAAVWEA